MHFELSKRRASSTPRTPRRKKEHISFLVLLDPVYKEIGIPPVLLELKEGIGRAAPKGEITTDMHLVSSNSPLPDEVLERNPQGFILVGEKPGKKLGRALMRKPCCWVLDNRFDPEWGDQIAPNHKGIGFVATEHLVHQGCTDILSVNLGPENHFLQLRETGMRTACKNHGIAYQKIYATHSPAALPATYPATAYLDEITHKIKSLKKAPDGLFFDSDFSASLLIPRLLNEGVSLKHTALISCNNQEAYLHNLSPRPATIDIHLKTIGELAITQLLYRIKNGNDQPRIHTLVSPSLIDHPPK